MRKMQVYAGVVFFFDVSGDSSCRVVFLVIRFLMVLLFFLFSIFLLKPAFSVLHGVINVAGR